MTKREANFRLCTIPEHLDKKQCKNCKNKIKIINRYLCLILECHINSYHNTCDNFKGVK